MSTKTKNETILQEQDSPNVEESMVAQEDVPESNAEMMEQEVFEEEIDQYEEDAMSDEIDSLILNLRNTAENKKALVSIPSQKGVFASEHVIAGDKAKPVITLATRKKEEFTELGQSIGSTTRILKGEIVGYHFANSEKVSSTLMAEIKYGTGQWEILIPWYALFDCNLNEKVPLTKEETWNLEKEMIRRLGSPVEFVVSAYSKDLKVFIGDRLRAMELKSRHWYKNRAKPVKPGDIVQATIVSVARTSVTVNANGAEIKVPQEELAYNHVGDATEEMEGAERKFYPGKVINVRIKQIQPYTCKKNDKEYDLFKVAGSIKLAEPDLRGKIYDSIRLGAVCMATVTWVLPTGIIVRLKGENGIDAMLPPQGVGDIPSRGDKIAVKITKKQEDDKRIFAKLVRRY